MGKKLVFKIGEETIPSELSKEGYKETPFAEPLDNAVGMFTSLLAQSLSSGQEREGKIMPASSKYSENIKNNILAFLGDRGTGKTSCLLSVKRIFLDSDDDPQTKELIDKTHLLPIIDPSFFDEHHNILEIFVGELYRNYKGLLKDWERKSKDERENLRGLQSEFSKAKNALRFVDKPVREEPLEEQEGLLGLSESVNMARIMGDLIESFLKCIGKEILVVSVDDIDLSIKEAYRMMEQIRKYLVIPKVVILMAAKFEQLQNSVELYMTEHYKAIMPGVINQQGIKTMAERYLDKFLPLDRRIYMPTLDDYSLYKLEILDKGEEIAREENKFDSVEYAVLSLIYKKCGFLFYNYEETSSLIVPRNLRELRMLVTMLAEMRDRTEDPRIHKLNKEAFKNYFYNQWILCLPEAHKKIATTIVEEKDMTKINKSVVSMLWEASGKLKWNSNDSISSGWIYENSNSVKLQNFRHITDPDNYSENVSLGDVLFIIKILKDRDESGSLKHLIFFITSFYSIKLYELYDEMTRNAVEAGNRNDEENNPLMSLPKLKSTVDYDIPDYFKLIGRSYFVLTGDSFIPSVSDSKMSKESRLINGRILNDQVNKLVHDFSADNGLKDDYGFNLRLKLIECFILCVVRGQISFERNEFSAESDNWRVINDDFYFTAFGGDGKELQFEVTAPFVNMIYPKYAYDRFHGALYDIAEQCPGSLLNQLFKGGGDREEIKDDKARLMSRICVRNIEVLNDLNLWLTKRKNQFLTGQNDDLKTLIDFFESFQMSTGGYTVKTYAPEKISDKENYHHTIWFSPILIISDFLKELGREESEKIKNSRDINKSRKECRELFYRIYRNEKKLAANSLYSREEIRNILRESRGGNIPLKERMLSNFLNNTERIMSNLLIEYLSGPEVYDKMFFGELMDEDLFAMYSDLIRTNVESRVTSGKKRIEEMEEQIGSYDSTLKFLKSQVADIQKKRVRLVRREAEKTAELENKNEEIKDIRKGILSLDRRGQELNQKLASLDNELKGINDKIDNDEAAVNEQSRQLKNDEENLRERHDKQDYFILDLLQLNLKNKRGELEKLKSRLENTRKTAAEKNEQKSQLMREKEEIGQKIEFERKREQETGTQLMILEQNRQMDRNGIDSLVREEERNKDEQNEYRNIIMNLRRDLIRSKRELERAAESHEKVMNYFKTMG